MIRGRSRKAANASWMGWCNLFFYLSFRCTHDSFFAGEISNKPSLCLYVTSSRVTFMHLRISVSAISWTRTSSVLFITTMTVDESEASPSLTGMWYQFFLLLASWPFSLVALLHKINSWRLHAFTGYLGFLGLGPISKHPFEIHFCAVLYCDIALIFDKIK